MGGREACREGRQATQQIRQEVIQASSLTSRWRRRRTKHAAAIDSRLWNRVGWSDDEQSRPFLLLWAGYGTVQYSWTKPYRIDSPLQSVLLSLTHSRSRVVNKHSVSFTAKQPVVDCSALLLTLMTPFLLFVRFITNVLRIPSRVPHATAVRFPKPGERRR